MSTGEIQMQNSTSNSNTVLIMVFALIVLSNVPFSAVSANTTGTSSFNIRYSVFDIQYSQPPDSCPDLQIDSIRVVEYKKKCYVIEYTLSNHGTAPAPLLAKSEN